MDYYSTDQKFPWRGIRPPLSVGRRAVAEDQSDLSANLEAEDRWKMLLA